MKDAIWLGDYVIDQVALFSNNSYGKNASFTVGYPQILDLGRPAQKCPTLSNIWIEPVTICRHGPGLLEVAN